MKRNVMCVAGALVVGALALSGCGGSGSSTATTAAGTAPASSAATDTSKVVEQLETRPSQIVVTAPLGEKVPQGKVVDWLQCSIPACTQLGGALRQATDAIGWKLRTIDAGITPESVKAAWEVAARDKPDFVIASGFPHPVYQDELKALLAADVPVVNIDITDRPLAGEYIVQGTADFLRNGSKQAEWVFAQAGADAHILYVTSSTFGVEVARHKGFVDKMGELCASCNVKTIDIPAADIGTPKVATTIVGAVRSDPEVQFVAIGVGDLAIGLNGALAAAGFGDKDIIFSDISPALQQDLANGTVLKAAVMMEAPDMMWQAIDLLLRLSTDQSPKPSLAPANVWFVTPRDAQGYKPPYPVVADYQAQFKELWGVG